MQGDGEQEEADYEAQCQAEAEAEGEAMAQMAAEAENEANIYNEGIRAQEEVMDEIMNHVEGIKDIASREQIELAIKELRKEE